MLIPQHCFLPAKTKCSRQRKIIFIFQLMKSIKKNNNVVDKVITVMYFGCITNPTTHPHFPCIGHPNLVHTLPYTHDMSTTKD